MRPTKRTGVEHAASPYPPRIVLSHPAARRGRKLTRRAGSQRPANSSMKPQPSSAITSAGAVISNMLNGASPMSRATPSTRMLVEVPISVIIPPSTVM